MGDEGSAERPARRVRYKGTHPRRFHEKYKELSPERYAADVAKIVAGGNTPAGTHRPIMVREILQVLTPKAGEVAVDCTLGYGGHARELLTAVQPGGKLIAVDADPVELPKTEARLRAMGYPESSLIVRRMNFAGVAKLIAQETMPSSEAASEPAEAAAESAAGADVMLADLGVSSMQIDDPQRGFTFKADGPLDMRMNPGRGISAAQLLSKVKEKELALLLSENADEPMAQPLARAIVRAHAEEPLLTTESLAAVVRAALAHLPRLGDAGVELSVRRVFQALRIEVNDEFGSLDTLLRNLPGCLKPGGRVAILTFHSGEDRRVKAAFKEGLRTGIYIRIAEEVTRASKEEQRSNPRSASAKLRWAVRSSGEH